MNNLSLYYFICVAEDLNISKTAKKLYISQQALSEQIRKLEQQYDTVFFERTPRLRLTYQGEKMLAYARKAVTNEQELISSLRADNKPGRMRLSVGVASTRASVLLPNVIKEYRRQYPNVLISIVTSSPNGMSSELRLGNIDLYFGMIENALQGTITVPLFKDSYYFMASEELIKTVTGPDEQKLRSKWKNGISLEDAARFPIAFPPAGTSLRTLLERELSEIGAIPNVTIESASQSLMLDICKTGTCSSYISTEFLYTQMKQGSILKDLCVFPANGLPQTEYSGVVYNKGFLPQHARDFVECSRKESEKIMKEVEEKMSSLT